MAIICLILIHIIGDFYLNKNEKTLMVISEPCPEKFNKFKIIIIQTVKYIIPYFSIVFLINWYLSFFIILTVGLFHIIINTCIPFNKISNKKIVLFLFYQGFHIILFIAMYKLFKFNSTFVLKFQREILLIGSVLFLTRPSVLIVNYIFSDIFENYQSSQDDSKYDVGAIIGILERIIILGLCIVGEITVIALIITIKTWARNNDIKENKNQFGNKYLIGTLTSILLALIAGFVCYIMIGRIQIN